ncbi:response regulator [Vampirovibrio chlorellavorus]|uniref:response regulator n=1 Tax=Vampirovibrio chlorellavorus TaxID=758823 RepID=UPI0026EBCF7B|nr:response regulator [Vampirovibrio chlorellavorus]
MSKHNNSPRKPHILIADDDSDDRQIIREALNRNMPSCLYSYAEDGEEALDFLYHRGQFSHQNAPPVDLILLDLNMPRKTGMEVLEIIKKEPSLKHIPVVVLTTSQEKDDVIRTYELGVNSFMIKPISYDSLLNAMKILGKYWFETVELPTQAT